MTKQHYKLYGLAFTLALALAALGYRLWDLQVTRHDELRGLAEDNTIRTFWREPIRGQILDIRGNPLATSMPVKVVCADPSLIGERRLEVAHALAPLLEMEEAVLAERLAPRLRKDGQTNKYVVIKRKVPIDTWQKIQGTMLTNINFGVIETNLPKKDQAFYRNLRRSAIFSEEDQLRSYPNKALAAHILGYVGIIDKPTNAVAAVSTTRVTNGTAVMVVTNAPSTNSDKIELEVGMSGIEMAFNSKLAGIRGWRKTELDNRKRELFSYRDQDVEPRNGLNVVLTIDAGLQNIVETELLEGARKNTPTSISCIMVRPRTGEILAMATLPTFDPNQASKYPLDFRRNRVISDIAEPGSTFKIVPVSAALNERVISLTDVFNCENGKFSFAGKVLHDHEPYGDLSVVDIIKKSSNIGAAKVGMRLGENRLYDYIRAYGFGTRTGIPLPGEIGGILPPVKKWSKVSIAQIPMGHGLAVTPLQTVLAMSAIANKGMLMKPMLVDRLVDEEGKIVAKYQPQPVGRVISEEAAAKMVIALKTVPTKEGTAEAAKLDNYTVAGKTGTATKVEGGHYVHKYFSSFIGFFPADNPELCISVVMDNPSQGGHYGGKVAGPVFKAIAQRAANYLNIKPDIEPELEPEASPTTLATMGATPIKPKAKDQQGGKD